MEMVFSINVFKLNNYIKGIIDFIINGSFWFCQSSNYKSKNK